MRIIVCGSRRWTDYFMIYETLAAVVDEATIIHGDARGADKIAGLAARRLGFEIETYPVDTTIDGPWPLAGHRRNERMLATGVDHVMGFKDGFDPQLRSGGTEHMIRIAAAAGVEWRVYSHD